MTYTIEDWKAAAAMIQAEDRERLGELPEFDVMLAYLAGTLDEQETERVREFIVAYPELRAVLFTEFESEDEGPVVTPEEIAEDCRKIQERMRER